MTKKILTILLVFLPLIAQAHNSMVSIGVRGGGQTFLSSTTDPSSSVKPGFGPAGTAELRYTFYGCFTDRIGMGFTLGAGVGFGSTAIQGTHVDTYTNTDYLGHPMDYTVSSSFRQREQFAKAEATLMASFCFGNVIVNIGPRFMMPFAAKSNLTVTDVSIDAYYPEYYVHVVDQPITGYLATPYSQTVNNILPTYNVLMTAEVGYEWYVNDKSCLGFQLYADVGVWNKKGDGLSVTGYGVPLIQVSPITDAANPVPDVKVNSLDGKVTSRRYLDFGLRVYYAFSVSKEKNNHHYNYHRDTRDHRNRYLWR